MDSLLERLTDQLDGLLPLLALSHRDVFELMMSDPTLRVFLKTEDPLPDSYETYRRHVTHGAFLLGYAYSEAFLADLVREIYQHRPHMLPDEKQLRFSELRKVRSRRALLDLMITKEVNSVFFQSMEAVADYFQSKLSLRWPADQRTQAVVASLIRNCIIHNMGRVDSRLAQMSDYDEAQQVSLSVEDVHKYGVAMRTLAEDLFQRAEKAFLNRPT